MTLELKTGTVNDGIVSLTAVALSQAIHQRTLSCVEVISAYFAHIDRMNPHVNALVALGDRDDALREAARADADLAAGVSRGWMHGFPQAPKDTSPVAGMVTTRGSRIYRDTVTQADSVMIARMRQAGSIFIARSNAPEFGLGSHTYNAVYGVTRNAFDQSRTAGGSSGGAAVALALRMLPVADGSDMMGSLRNPAAFNNVFGLRPSFGRVPGYPAEDVFFDQLSTGGPMARSVADLAMLLSVQAGYDQSSPLGRRDDPAQFAKPLTRDCRDVRIGWLGDLEGYLPIESGVLDVCGNALRRFEAIGCVVEPARVDFELEQLWQAWTTLRSFQIAGAQRMHYADPAKRALLKPEAIWEIESGNALSASAVYLASVTRTAWFEALMRLFQRFDFLVLPSAQLFPFDASIDWPRQVAGRAMDTYHRWMEVVVPASMAGLPVLNVPAGFGAGGLPMGMQVIGSPDADWSLLQLGHAYEQACDCVNVSSPLLGTA
ncbi:amidase [Paraburkholderia sp. ZP32-5]|uniref:amidase n=1 Tax=Paraburkholderia sp. ZP32-5 TaxID=2883245 RepID=UPI001F296C4B|nr:amidase [Paraburkholderia sp. ZP32-5]